MIPLIPNPGDWISDQAGQVAEDWLVDLAAKTGQSAQVILEKSATFWVTGVKSPQLTYATEANPYTPASTVGYLWSHLNWYVAGLAIFSIFFAAGKMAWQRNGAPARELLQSILTLVVVSGAGIAAISLATTGSDQAASYILSGATTTPDGKPTDFQTAFGQMFTKVETAGSTAVLLIGLYGLIMISTFIQIALLLIRGGMLFLLAGVLPLAAAATNTETGRQWFRKSLAWIIAFVLYKPVAAIVYATAFQLTREGSATSSAGPLAPAAGDELIKVVTGLVMCLLAIFALPALLRFTAPAVAAAAGGGGGGSIGALGGAMAMGAKALMSRGGGGRAGGGGGGRGQPGTQNASSTAGPQGNDKPASKPATKTAGTGGGGAAGGASGGTGAKAGAKGGAGAAAGATAAAVADGIKKAQNAPGNAVSNAAGEPSSGASTGSSRSKPNPSRPGTPQAGPTGGQGFKPTSGPQPTQRTNPPSPEGPSGGKRK